MPFQLAKTSGLSKIPFFAVNLCRNDITQTLEVKLAKSEIKKIQLAVIFVLQLVCINLRLLVV